MSRKIHFIVAIIVVAALATGAARAVPLLTGTEQTAAEREGFAAVTLDWMRSLLKTAERILGPQDAPQIPPKEGNHLDPDGNK